MLLIVIKWIEFTKFFYVRIKKIFHTVCRTLKCRSNTRYNEHFFHAVFEKLLCFHFTVVSAKMLHKPKHRKVTKKSLFWVKSCQKWKLDRQCVHQVKNSQKVLVADLWLNLTEICARRIHSKNHDSFQKFICDFGQFWLACGLWFTSSDQNCGYFWPTWGQKTRIGF